MTTLFLWLLVPVAANGLDSPDYFHREWSHSVLETAKWDSVGCLVRLTQSESSEVRLRVSRLLNRLLYAVRVSRFRLPLTDSPVLDAINTLYGPGPLHLEVEFAERVYRNQWTVALIWQLALWDGLVCEGEYWSPLFWSYWGSDPNDYGMQTICETLTKLRYRAANKKAASDYGTWQPKP